jgi:hypothetical protein
LIDDNGNVSSKLIFAGNAPSLSFNWEQQEEELESSTQGPALIIDQQITSLKLILTATLSEHRKENFERWLLATSQADNQAAGSDVVIDIEDAELDRYHDTGVVHGTGLTLMVGTTPLVAGTDYVYESETGFVHIKPGGSVVAGDHITGTIDRPAVQITRMSIGQKPIKYVRAYYSNNLFTSAPSQFDRYTFPKARFAPNGEMAVISENRVELPVQLTIIADTENFPSDPYGWMKRETARA